MASGALCEMRLRQLAHVVVRRSTSRADDHRPPEPHAYAALEWRVLVATNAGFSGLFDLKLFDRGTSLRPVPSAAAAHKGRADAHLSADDVSAAVASYTAALAESEHPALLVDRAKALLRARLPKSALADATRAFAAAPGWRSARLRLAECLGATGDALGLEALAEIDAHLGGGRDWGSENLARAGRDAAWETSAVAETASFEASKAKGDAAFRAKRPVEAVEAYTSAIRAAHAAEKRSLAAVFSNRAAAAASLGAHRDALADGIAAAALASDWVKGHLRVAAALRALRLPRDAVEAYFNALRLLPGDLDLNAGLCSAVEELRAQRAS